MWPRRRRETPVPSYHPVPSEDPPRLGYRYWKLHDDGRLEAPMHSEQIWDVGVTDHRCAHSCCGWYGCSCGLYAWAAREDGSVCARDYFDPRTCDVRHTNGIVGAVWMYDALHPSYDERLRAKRAVIAALALPKGAPRYFTASARRASLRHGVSLVKPSELTDAAWAHPNAAKR